MKTIRHLLLIISVCSYVLSSAQDHFEAIQFESVGPSVMSGRVVDLEVNPEDPTEFYVAYASGGLWHTTDNGTSFAPIFDNAPTQNLGEIAMHWPSRTYTLGPEKTTLRALLMPESGFSKPLITAKIGHFWARRQPPYRTHFGRPV